MPNSRSLRYLALLVGAAVTVGCGDVTGPGGTGVSQKAPALAPPSESADLALSRWILISGVWVEVDEPIDK